jgi:hypothetical protein
VDERVEHSRQLLTEFVSAAAHRLQDRLPSARAASPLRLRGRRASEAGIPTS